MDLLYVSLSSIGSIAVLFFLTKLSGNKHISELTIFDYIIGISIGSIAADMATDLENIERPLIAMIIYGLFSLLSSVIAAKSIRFRRFVFGSSIILFRRGTLYKKSFNRARIDLNEFLMQCRSSGYFDLSQIDTVIFEPSGKLSFLPLSQNRPATPADLKIVPEQDSLTCTVIIDGEVMKKNLHSFGRNDEWLRNELKLAGFKNPDDVFLGMIDENGKASFFKANDNEISNSIYE